MDNLLNSDILKFQNVRVIDEDGNNLGVLASKAALIIAENKDLDLVCVNAKIDPPICKILDFKKLEYQKKKAQKDNEKRARLNEIETKTITFKSGIAEHDLTIKEKQINEFLKKNAIVDVVIKLMGREAYSDTLRKNAEDLMDSFISRVDSISIIASENGPKNIIRKIQKKKEVKSGRR